MALEDPHSDARQILFVASCGVGVISGLISAHLFGVNGVVAAVLGIVIALSYPVAGAIVASMLEDFRGWAYLGKLTPRSRGDNMIVAACWPICVLYALIVYPAMGIINRLFPN